MIMIKKITATFLICIIALSCVVYHSDYTDTTAYAVAASADFPVTEDTYVEIGNPNTPFGTAVTLPIKNDGTNATTRQGFMKIDFSTLNAESISSAKLYMYTSSAQSTGYLYAHSAINDWSAGTLTYSSVAGKTLDYLNNVQVILGDVPKWYNIDVTSFIQERFAADKAASFRITAEQGKGTYNIASADNSNTSIKPYLKIEYEAPNVSDDEKVAADKASLNVSYNGTDTAISLPSAGSPYGSIITWESNSAAIDAETGTVTRPETADVHVNLTATIKNGDAQDTKTFIVTVKKKDIIADIDFPVTEDTYTQLGSGGTNFGTDKTINLKDAGSGNTANRRGYMKVDFTSLKATSIQSAELNFYVESAEIKPAYLYLYSIADENTVTYDNWSESTITWNNSTSLKDVYIVNKEVSNAPGWYSVDVTSFIKSEMKDKIASFKITAQTDKGLFAIASSDADTNRPYLRIKAMLDEPAFSFTDAYGEPTGKFIDAGSGSVRVNAKDTITSALVLALYDGEGTMQDIAVDYKEVTNGAETSFSAEINELPGNLSGYYVQAYMLDSLNGMKPYGNPVSESDSAHFPQSSGGNITENITINNGVVTVKGKLEAITAKKSADRIVTLEVINPNQNTDIDNNTAASGASQYLNHIYQTRTDGNGNYIFRYTMADDAKTGVYTVKIGGEAISILVIGSFHYKNPIKEQQAVAAVNNAADIESLKRAMQQYEEDLELVFPLIDELVDDTPVYQAILNAPKFTDSDRILAVYKESILLTAINEAVANNRIEELINDYNSVLQLNAKRYEIFESDSFSESDKNSVYSSLMTLGKTSFVSLNEVRDVFDSVVYVHAFNKIISWGEVRQLLADHNDLLKLDFTKYNKLSNKTNVEKDMVSAILKTPYTSIADIKEKFYLFVDKQEELERNTPKTSNTGGGGGGGGGTTVMSKPEPVIAPLETYMADDNKVENTFKDLEGFSWAEESIYELAEKGVIQGYEGLFNPQNNVTREEFVKMIMLGFDLVDETAVCSFSDVGNGEWYYKYIAGAEKLGLANGTGDGMFGIGQEISRQDMTVLAYRAAVLAGVQIESVKESTGFDDDESIADYAREAVLLMQQANIINGFETNTFAPASNANRAQSAVIICKLLKLKK